MIKFALGLTIDGHYCIKTNCGSVGTVFGGNHVQELETIEALYPKSDIYISPEQLKEIQGDNSLKGTKYEWLYGVENIHQYLRIN